MTNTLLPAFLAAILCSAPALAQEPAAPAPSPDTTAPAASMTPPAAAPTETTTTTSPGIRIVRLSQAVGEVKLDRTTGNGFESAFANLPIVQGSKLRTDNGVAEVEFEDSSSLRLTPNSLVEFPVLSMNASGVRTSTVHVVQGDVYASMTKGKDDNVSLTFGKETVALSPGSHVELALNGKQPRLDVLDGTAQAMNGTTTTEVGKKKGLLFDPAGTNEPKLVGKDDKGQFADWDKQQAEYHQRMAPTGNSYAGTPYSYGLADMNYYGSFEPVGGCGTMWRPYMVSAGWSPFANGVWAWYPNAGYSWVSPYPWGWTAFHSGAWDYCPGAGWGWRPSNGWTGLGTTPTALTKQPGRLNQLKPPLTRPRPMGPTMVPVNQKPLVFSKLNQDRFVFQRDSAGLGVPRATFGKLNHISSGVIQHGTAERTVFMSTAPNGRPEGNGGFSAANRNSMGNNMGARTMPATGRVSGPSPTMPNGGMGGGRSTMSPGSAGGRMGSAGGPSMGGGATGGGHASTGGHH